MITLYKNAFKRTNEGLILAVPLILAMCLISLYINYAITFVDTILELILAAITLLFMSAMLSAGWFYMVKKCIDFTKKDFILDSDKNKESFKLIQYFSEGIGKYFIKYIGVLLIFTSIAIFLGFFLYIIYAPLIKDMHLAISQLSTTSNSTQDIANFVKSLSPEQVMAVLKLELIWMTIATICSFLTMLWMPEVIYTDYNPLVALFTSIGKVFARFGKSILLFIYISVLTFFISFIGTFAFLNPIVYLIVMVLYFYFTVYIVVLLFSYYDNEFRDTNDSKEQPQTESDSDSRCDS